MDLTEAGSEALITPPILEQSQDQSPGEESKSQAQEASQSHPMTEAQQKWEFFQTHLKNQSKDCAIKTFQSMDIPSSPSGALSFEIEDGSSNSNLPALVISSGINNSSSQGTPIRTEIPDSDDYSEYSPDDEEVPATISAELSLKPLESISGSGDIIPVCQDTGETFLQRREETKMFDLLSTNGSSSHEVSSMSDDATGSQQTSDTVQSHKVMIGKSTDSAVSFNDVQTRSDMQGLINGIRNTSSTLSTLCLRQGRLIYQKTTALTYTRQIRIPKLNECLLRILWGVLPRTSIST